MIVRPRERPDTPLMLRAMLYNRGYGSVEYRAVEEILAIEFTKEAPVVAKPVSVTRDIPVVSTVGATPVDFVLTLPPMKDSKSEFLVNGVPSWKAKPYLAKLGEKQVWIVKNESTGIIRSTSTDSFSRCVDDQGNPVRPMALKDTVNVPMKTTVRLLVTFDERPGEWMFHCHILDHADGGLMGTVIVGDGATKGHRHPIPQ